MEKIAIIINGRGGVGKDTLCSFIADKYSVENVSAIDPIKRAAELLGWTGEKDNKSRKFLSDLKMLSIEYNDFPTKYLIQKYNQFMNGNKEILFIHIREGNEISHLVQSVSGKIVTLLIKRDQCSSLLGNSSDDNVEKYHYDYVYNNDCELSEAKRDFIIYFENNILGELDGKQLFD